MDLRGFEMIISMDKKYRTRDGRDVRLLCVDGEGSQPVVGMIGEGVDRWHLDGRFTSAYESTGLDLIEYHEPDIRTIWVNVYEDSVDPYDDEDDARSYISNIRVPIAIAQPVTFEVKRNA